MKELLSENNIQFLYIDITDGMLNLKRFLKYRDSRPEFEEVRKAGRVGLPCLVVNDDDDERIIFGEPDLKELKDE
ncbi:glutaredoxin domain-containing protein [Brassicibacter mesophilus]|uniref:glutaredoxin domain-containing protein n=1 Tax=Brassicibacter mesophilus TaxID=745119 RepID=UPI003D235768